MRRGFTTGARTGRNRGLAVLAAAWLGASTFAQCSPAPQPTPEAPKNAWAGDLKPTLTIRELMEHFIDPTADFIFDAVVFFRPFMAPPSPLPRTTKNGPRSSVVAGN